MPITQPLQFMGTWLITRQDNNQVPAGVAPSKTWTRRFFRCKHQQQNSQQQGLQGYLQPGLEGDAPEEPRLSPCTAHEPAKPQSNCLGKLAIHAT
jgi:hypothetical protein